MEKWTDKVAVITGVSSGIGNSIAKRLVIQGIKVIGLSRRVERVIALANELKNERGQLYPMKCDVTNESELSEVFASIISQFGCIDILINNAAYGSPNATLIGGPMSEHRKLIETNILAVTHCTEKAVQVMMEKGVHGQIININSILGHVIPMAKPIPTLYPASKFAITAFTETLRQNLLLMKNKKIKVTSISPGFVDTEMIRLENGELNPFLGELHPLNCDDIADSVIYVLSLPTHAQVTELTIRHVEENF